MRHLHSSPTPEATTRLTGLEQQRVGALGEGTALPMHVANGYRHPEIKQPLMAETYEKCAYCESKITHVYYGDVEHILPKAVVPERMFDYDNLTIACAVCNGSKGAYYDADQPLLDPYLEDPATHMLALGDLVWHRPGDRTADRTVRLLDLNRPELRERRMERLESVAHLADKYEAEPAGLLKDLLRRELLDRQLRTMSFRLSWMAT